MKKIALFGTSADPPTLGHQKILEWLSQDFDLVAVWASDNPFKSNQTELHYRTEMLELLIKNLNTPRDNIKLYPELSYPRTIITVDKAKQIWVDADFTVVIGSDLVCGRTDSLSALALSPNNGSNHKGLQIMSWYRIKDLLAQVKLLIVPRPGYVLSNADLEQLQQLGAKYAIADLVGPAVSSTAYREKGDTTNLTSPIVDYIHQEQLYAWQDTVQSR